MTVDPLQIAQHVDMQGTCFDGIGSAGTDPLVMGFGVVSFQIADRHFLADQRSRHADITGHENVHRQIEVFQNPGMEALQFLEAGIREAGALLELPGKR